MNPRGWTPDHRDALLTRVTAITVGTAVAGCVGAAGLAVGLAGSAQATTSARKATGSSSSTASLPRTVRPLAPTDSSDVSPAQVQVEVLNGIGVAGAAHLVAEQLRSAGFDVVAVGNAPRTVAASGIIYSPAQSAAFRTLSRSTGVTLSSAQGSGPVLVLVVGPDWPGELPSASSGNGGGGSLAAPPAPPQGRSSNGGGTTTSGGS